MIFVAAFVHKHHNNAPQCVQQATFDHFGHPGYDRREPATRGRVVTLGQSAQGSAATGSTATADVPMTQQGGDSITQNLDLQDLKFDEPDYLPTANTLEIHEKLMLWFEKF